MEQPAKQKHQGRQYENDDPLENSNDPDSGPAPDTMEIRCRQYRKKGKENIQVMRQLETGKREHRKAEDGPAPNNAIARNGTADDAAEHGSIQQQ